MQISIPNQSIVYYKCILIDYSAVVYSVIDHVRFAKFIRSSYKQFWAQSVYQNNQITLPRCLIVKYSMMVERLQAVHEVHTFTRCNLEEKVRTLAYKKLLLTLYNFSHYMFMAKIYCFRFVFCCLRIQVMNRNWCHAVTQNRH